MLQTVKDGKEVLEKIEQTDLFADRTDNAKMCMATLKLSIPTLIDREDNKVNQAYSGWPDRMYVVDVDGTIGYKGGPGPGQFKPAEVEKWLKENVGERK